MDTPIKTINIAKNRGQKRALTKEVAKNHNRLAKIERGFLVDLFCSDMTYLECYIKYLNEWNNEIRIMESTNQFRYTHVDHDYFSELYKPLEHAELC